MSVDLGVAVLSGTALAAGFSTPVARAIPLTNPGFLALTMR